MGRLALILIGAAGCGRIGFDATDAPTRTDACVVSGAWEPAQALGSVNSPGVDWGMWLSTSRLELVFASDRGNGSLDLYRSTRASVVVPFEPPTVFLATTGIDEDDAFVTDDDQEIWFNDTSSGNTDIRVAPRSNPQASVVEASVSTTADDETPELTQDKLTIYFTSSMAGTKDLYRAKRGVVGLPFGAPELLPMSDIGFDCCLSIAHDGTVVYVTDHGTATGREVMMTHANGSGFDPPTAFAPAASLGLPVQDVYITREGHTVVFAATTATKQEDLYFSDAICL